MANWKKKALLLAAILVPTTFVLTDTYAKPAIKAARAKKAKKMVSAIRVEATPLYQVESCTGDVFLSSPETEIYQGHMNVVTTATFSCMAEGTETGPCQFSVLQGLWQLQGDGWNLVGRACQTVNVNCGVLSSQVFYFNMSGYPAGSYQMTVGVFSGNCSQNGEIITSSDLYFTID